MSQSDNKTRGEFSILEDQPTDWFEPLYSKATLSGEGVPWANMKTHPSFTQWLGQNSLSGSNKRALVVGCGMGDDAIELESLGFDVTAFDVSATAITYCQERFPDSNVNFLQADLLKSQPQWQGKFDFVLEIYTVQALPPKYEQDLIRAISGFVATGGQLLVVAEVATGPRAFDNGPPWVLTPDHVDSFVSCGLNVDEKTVDTNPSKHGESTYVTSFKRSEK